MCALSERAATVRRRRPVTATATPGRRCSYTRNRRRGQSQQWASRTGKHIRSATPNPNRSQARQSFRPDRGLYTPDRPRTFPLTKNLLPPSVKKLSSSDYLPHLRKPIPPPLPPSGSMNILVQRLNFTHRRNTTTSLIFATTPAPSRSPPSFSFSFSSSN